MPTIKTKGEFFPRARDPQDLLPTGPLPINDKKGGKWAGVDNGQQAWGWPVPVQGLLGPEVVLGYLVTVPNSHKPSPWLLTASPSQPSVQAAAGKLGLN